MRDHPILLTSALVALMHVQCAMAQTTVDRFYPPTAPCGEETIVKAEGKFPSWPTKVACDRKEIKIECEQENGTLKVSVPTDATRGIAWLRFYDAKSASKWIPLVITSIASTIEKEPNNKNADAVELSLPAIAVGKLQKGGDIDVYRVELEKDQRLVASVTANQVLGSPMDAVLQLSDLQGNVLSQSEDVRGRDPQIVYDATDNEKFLLRIFAFPEVPTGSVSFAGAASFVYTIDVTTGPFLDHAFETHDSVEAFGHNLPKATAIHTTNATDVSPSTVNVDGALGWSWLSSRAETATRVGHRDQEITELPIVANGHFSAPDETHNYRFTAEKGIKYRAEAYSKAAGFLVDSHLQIIDPVAGNLLASNDDLSRGGYDAGVDFSAKQNGPIEVQLSDLVDGFGPRHAYELLIQKSEPTCRPTVNDDHFLLTASKSLEITITVNRDKGFNQNIQFSAANLPDGVTSTPIVSQAKGASAKTVKLKLSASAGVSFSGSMSITGQALDKEDKPTNPTIQVKHQLRSTIAVNKFWLTVSD